MRLQILLPTEVLIDTEVDRVAAEAEDGSLCILPRHVDFLASLSPGILTFGTGGKEAYAAVDEGMLVKIGETVLVATANAVLRDELGSLWKTFRERFRDVGEKEKTARSAAAKLEADMVRRFLELGER